MITFYFNGSPNPTKVALFLEEAGLPYRVEPVDITKGRQFEPDFLAISPNNRIPAIVDEDGPDGAPLSVFESGAILVYLAEKTGRFLPQDPRGRVAVMEWLMWQMGGFGPMPGQVHHFLQVENGQETLPFVPSVAGHRHQPAEIHAARRHHCREGASSEENSTTIHAVLLTSTGRRDRAAMPPPRRRATRRP